MQTTDDAKIRKLTIAKLKNKFPPLMNAKSIYTRVMNSLNITF